MAKKAENKIDIKSDVKTDNKTFEEAIIELEQIVNNLERGELTLEESIAGFQKGIELSKLCSSKLDEAEKKIGILLQDDNGNLVEQDFCQE